ncbi:MAG: histidinol phosphate phosphatase [Alphaproteobacteria bacterium]|nr:histidinol phosphate phosphatase [Alphaproteobacteria bacterium]
MPNETCPRELIDFARQLAEASGEIIRPAFRASFAMEGKADHSPVTEIDRKAEEALRRILADRYPDHGIWGEEYGKSNIDAEYVWVLDPIDGTRAFIVGKPVFGTLIALLHKGVPILGVIDQPVSRERWIGAKGHATLYNGQPCRTRSCAALGDAVAIITPNLLLETPNAGLPDYLRPFQLVAQACKTYSTAGGDCYGHGLLASGHCDLIIEDDYKLHDYAALVPIIEGAGGMITDWEGRPLRPSLGETVTVMAAGDLRAGRAVLSLLRPAP